MHYFGILLYGLASQLMSYFTGTTAGQFAVAGAGNRGRAKYSSFDGQRSEYIAPFDYNVKKSGRPDGTRARERLREKLSPSMGRCGNSKGLLH